MEDGTTTNYRSTQKLPNTYGVVALNDKYAALLSDGEVQVTRLKQLDEHVQQLPCPIASGWSPSVVALSAGWPDLCAVSNGSIAYVFDLNTFSLQTLVPGIGRTVTSISFPTLKSKKHIVTGHIDGGICLWDLENLNKPIRRAIGAGGACHAISSSHVDSNLLASTHGREFHIWNLDNDTHEPICSLRKTLVDAFTWHPSNTGLLALSNDHGEIRVCKRLNAFGDTNTAGEFGSNDQESDDGIFGEPDEIRNDLDVLSTLETRSRFKYLSWIREGLLLGLSQDGKSFLLWNIDDAYKLTETYSTRFVNAPGSVRILKILREIALLATGNASTEGQTAPSSVASRLDRDMERENDPPLATENGGETAGQKRSALVLQSSSSETRTERLSPTMAPQSIATQRAEESAFKRTSSQLQQKRRLAQLRDASKDLASKDDSNTKPDEISIPPADHHSGLPITLEEEDPEPPMPFLSPTIPARRISPNDISPLYESSMRPEQFPFASFDSSLPSTMFDGQDSDDSDDETFVDDMQGSAAFLPGGINVPLPKACGALFAPNGQLLTFFPPKPKLVSTRKELPVDEPQQDRREGHRTARLFPTFANLQSDFDILDVDSDSEDLDSIGGDASDNGLLPRFNFQPASFPSQLSWKSQDLAVNRLVNTQESQHKIMIYVHDVMDVCALHPTQRAIAEKYRLLCHSGESGSELCIHNAVVASNAGALELAEVWRLLAMFLDNQVPLDVLSVESLEDDAFVIARRARSIDWNGPVTDLSNPVKHSGKLRWNDHPFGGAWLVRRILDWAEQRADVQSLACMSCVLSEAESQFQIKQATPQNTFLTHLPTHSLAYLTETARDISNQKTKFGVPMLRRHAATITSFNESPTKAFRVPSNSSTPYLDSGSTPPFSFPSISRQSTRLSNSGSASPEWPRGSFSAAAKYYGQAITERLASYGTSPPSKKIDASPSTHTELSSSLPSGSWPGKSVSFASTPSEATSRRSFSVSAYRANQNDEGYDSDKTIEDSSLPHTPRSPGNAPMVNINDQDVFTDEISGGSRARLIPYDLAPMVIIWNQYYAELLRSWDMLLQATELEKVAGLTCGVLPQAGDTSLGDVGMVPTPISQRRKAVCDICFTATKGIMQICTSCFHSSHLRCLEEYVADLGEKEFTCPSGCGCQCSGLPHVVQNPSAAPAARPMFRKKASFTDPRRWRERMEGDTW